MVKIHIPPHPTTIRVPSFFSFYPVIFITDKLIRLVHASPTLLRQDMSVEENEGRWGIS